MAPPGELSARAAPPPRMPKLAYRNRFPTDQTSLSSTASVTTSASETQSNDPYPDQRLSTPSSTTTSSPVRPSFDSKNLTSPSLASNVSTPSSSKSPKKKANAVLGFLTLKEPSQLALEQFAEQQRKQAAEKGRKANQVGLGSISPQKLPPTVPKVNSKWDGVPESVRTRDSFISKKNRNSISTQATSRLSSVPVSSVFSLSSDGSQNPPNSIASSANSVSNVQLDLSPFPGGFNSTSHRRDSGPSITYTRKSLQQMSSLSMSSLPEITYFFPDNPNPTGALPCSSQELASRNLPSAPSAITIDGEDAKSSRIHRAPRVFNLDPIEPLSRGDTISHGANIDPLVTLKMASNPDGFLAGEAQEFKLPDDDDDEGEEEEGSTDELQDFIECDPVTDQIPTPSLVNKTKLTPSIGTPSPTTMNFSRPLSIQVPQIAADVSSLLAITTRPISSELPTVYEASSSNDTIAPLANHDGPPKDSDVISIAPSVTPSEMSASWYRSPRERLGLGGRIRKNDVLPWESHGEELAPDLAGHSSSRPEASTRVKPNE
ncbi:uncharacterized protein BDR25DRAFT_63471 [Lindgomyces ingoldianus]|uniref:Uncharacterized protein n=1 Tax=Lindgomyces ingoldianus TaxID=673940 RepID=A0ACB6QKZ7_9PLEO|nr:uncharacterized protein BDR25DRAFT_63471 [Lindgomyces ingoldianus]KAF2467537.1 hypothetical protein BDR25DRAFT_63471 [Lindgomyces ingoldianus]